MQSFSFEFTSLSGLTNLLSMDLTHVDRMCGSPHWRKDLGSALETLVSLRTIRLDAGEYGTVVETEGILPDSLQLEFNRGLMPITSLRSLESLAMVGASKMVVSQPTWQGVGISLLGTLLYTTFFAIP